MIVTMVIYVCGMYLSLGHVYKPISPNISSYIYMYALVGRMQFMNGLILDGVTFNIFSYISNHKHLCTTF
jgi:hypothetical protein